MALGTASARAGGALIGKAMVRVTAWGSAAMAATYLIGRLFGTVIA